MASIPKVPAVDEKTTVDVVDAEAETPRALRLLRFALIVAAAIIVALIVIVVIRSVVSAPRPPLGETASTALQLGSCLEQAATDLPTYSVVACNTEHPQQVFATIDLSSDVQAYTNYEAITAYAGQVCDRLLEYGLFVKPDVKNTTYSADSLAVPSESDYADGRTTALCSISAEDGSPLTRDLYQAMP